MNLNIDLSVVETQSKLNENTNSEIINDVNTNVDNKTEETSINNETSSPKYNLALNLEEVSKLEEEREIINEFSLDEDCRHRIIAAIGAGFATESVINARILENTNKLLQEARTMTKMVVRQGKLVKKNICPEGFKVGSHGMCERMSSRDIIAYRKRAMKAAKTRMRHKPTSASMRMRNRSLLVRGKNAGRVNRLVPAAASTQVK